MLSSPFSTFLLCQQTIPTCASRHHSCLFFMSAQTAAEPERNNKRRRHRRLSVPRKWHKDGAQTWNVIKERLSTQCSILKCQHNCTYIVSSSVSWICLILRRHQLTGTKSFLQESSFSVCSVIIIRAKADLCLRTAPWQSTTQPCEAVLHSGALN